MYPNHMKNRAPNLPAKSFKTIFSAWQPIFLTSESNFFNEILQFPLGFAQNGSWSVPNKQNPSFTLFFTHFLDPNFLRYGQDLYQAHTGHSRVSSLPIGLLYLQHPLPNLALQDFFEIFLRYSQSLYKTHTRETLVSSFPIGFFSHLQRANIDPPKHYRGKVSSMKNRTTPPYKSLFQNLSAV